MACRVGNICVLALDRNLLTLDLVGDEFRDANKKI